MFQIVSNDKPTGPPETRRCETCLREVGGGGVLDTKLGIDFEPVQENEYCQLSYS